MLAPLAAAGGTRPCAGGSSGGRCRGRARRCPLAGGLLFLHPLAAGIPALVGCLHSRLIGVELLAAGCALYLARLQLGLGRLDLGRIARLACSLQRRAVLLHLLTVLGELGGARLGFLLGGLDPLTVSRKAAAVPRGLAGLELVLRGLNFRGIAGLARILQRRPVLGQLLLGFLEILLRRRWRLGQNRAGT